MAATREWVKVQAKDAGHISKRTEKEKIHITHMRIREVCSYIAVRSKNSKERKGKLKKKEMMCRIYYIALDLTVLSK